MLWHELGHPNAIVDETWPTVDTAALSRETIEIVVQVNGKVRGKIVMPANSDAKILEKAALAEPNVDRFISGKTIQKIVSVPNKLINVVVTE